jgi:hypothetical protein
MSRIEKVIGILDAFLTRRDKVNQEQSIGHEFDAMCKTLFGVENGYEFISDFNALVSQLEEDVARIPLRDDQRAHYIRQLEPLRGLFGTKTYLVPWKQLFQHIAEGSLRNSLLLMDPLLDAQSAMLRQIPDRAAIRGELANLQDTLEQSGLQPDLRRLLLLELLKTRAVLANEKSFKESKIWEQYQRLMAQLAAAVSDLDEIERQKFRPALQALARRVRQGMGLVADNGLATPLKTFPVLDWNDPTP